MEERTQKFILLTVGVLVMSLIIGYFVFAWQEPTAPPPQRNVPAPINVGPKDQIKEGGLSVGSFVSLYGTVLAKDTGNVGIGTTTPRSKLSVHGTRSSTISTTTAAANIGGDDVFLYINAMNSSPWGVWMQVLNNAGSAFPLVLNPSGGNVGIGTTNPEYKLDVQGGGIRWGTSALNLDQGGSIELGNSQGSGNIPYIDFHYGKGSQEDFNARIINSRDGMLKISPQLTISYPWVVNDCYWCGDSNYWKDYVLAIATNRSIMEGESNSSTRKKAAIHFHNGGQSEGIFGLYHKGDHHAFFMKSVQTPVDLYVSGGYFCGGVDIAEKIQASETIQKGEVVCLSEENPGKVEKCKKPYDPKVAGVYSSTPGLTLGADVETEKPDHIDLALAGRVRVKVTTENGPIKIGDLLVTSSKPGYAMKGDLEKISQMPGVVLGKAMENLESGEGEILVLIMLR